VCPPGTNIHERYREMAAATSSRVPPSLKIDRMSKSTVTVLSANSILATRDWLVFKRLAASTWVKSSVHLSRFRVTARATLMSMKAASSSERPRKSRVVPTAQPAAFNLDSLWDSASSSTFEPAVDCPSVFALGDDLVGRVAAFFLEAGEDDDGI